MEDRISFKKEKKTQRSSFQNYDLCKISKGEQ